MATKEDDQAINLQTPAARGLARDAFVSAA